MVVSRGFVRRGFIGSMALVGMALLLMWLGTSISIGRGEEAHMGAELAEDLGLLPHHWPEGAQLQSTTEGVLLDGEILPDCSTVDDSGEIVMLVQIDATDLFYCIHAASEVEAWMIGQELNGRTPTDEEIAEMVAAFADDAPA